MMTWPSDLRFLTGDLNWQPYNGRYDVPEIFDFLLAGVASQ